MTPIRLRLCVAIFSPVLLASACANAVDQEIPVSFTVPSTVELAEPAPIRIEGLSSGEQVIIILERADDWSPAMLRQSQTTYIAGPDGAVDTSRSTPSGGAFEGADTFGLFWSMTRTQEDATEFSPGEVRVTIDVGGNGEVDHEATILLSLGAGVTTTSPLDGFPGAFLTMPKDKGADLLPVVVVLGGSEGNDFTARFMAPRLSQLGYAVLGLPYYSPVYYGNDQRFPNLPSAFAKLPVDYVEQAIAEVRTVDGVDPERVALYGVSKGAELALLAASLIPDEEQGGGYCAVAAVVPSDVVWAGWGREADQAYASFSYQGQGLPFVPHIGMEEAISRRSRGENVSFRVPQDKGREAFPERVPNARIEVESIDEPVLLLGGDADDTWDSGGMARNIDAARRALGLPTTTLVYPEAGHGLSGSGYLPGDEATAKARAEAYPILIDFLEKACREAR
ncbi:MAG: acyl-CoA thioesterase/BAAT N-terminal domain-containing protein [Pseudomonadota bacterium]